MKRNTSTTTVKRLAAGGFEIIDKATGVSLGRYGGREGDKWADDNEGNTITEGTRVSVDTLQGLIIQKAQEKGLTP